MKRIIYCSQAIHDFAPDELVDVLRVSRANNTRVGVTGMLLYCGQSFLQALEGDAAAIETTYERILADERHTNFRMLMHAEITARQFPDWGMGFEHLDEETLTTELPGYRPEVDYPLVNPDLVTNGNVALTLLGLYAKNRLAA